jgi:hypothetical protein
MFRRWGRLCRLPGKTERNRPATWPEHKELTGFRLKSWKRGKSRRPIRRRFHPRSTSSGSETLRRRMASSAQLSPPEPKFPAVQGARLLLDSQSCILVGASGAIVIRIPVKGPVSDPAPGPCLKSVRPGRSASAPIPQSRAPCPPTRRTRPASQGSGSGGPPSLAPAPATRTGISGSEEGPSEDPAFRTDAGKEQGPQPAPRRT